MNVRSLFRCLCALLALLLASASAWAVRTDYGFHASLDAGPLQGTTFDGTFSFDSAGELGVGQEFLTLTSLDFTLSGIHFTREDIDQGGQVIVQDGRVSYFTAAFFPPSRSPVSDIAFGFGGPGIIGYIVPPNMFGSGHDDIFPLPVPEPTTAGLLVAGLIAFAGLRRRARVPRLTAVNVDRQPRH